MTRPRGVDAATMTLEHVSGSDGATRSAEGPGARRDEDDLPERYEDLGLLAEGAFGEVRRVRDRALGRTVAMKVLHADLARSPGVRGRFLREARIGARLQHPSIVAVYDSGALPSGRLWITMPEVRGRTFAEVLEARAEGANVEEAGDGPKVAWSERRLLEAVARVAQAVSFAHENGVIHRDLNPRNLMVGERGEVFVVDWGLAREIDEESDDDGAFANPLDPAGPASPAEPGHGGLSTQAGTVLGTPAYMAPEQAQGLVHLHGPALDVHALGAIVYHVLAGRPPYTGSASAIVARICAGPPLPVNHEVAVPAELVAVVERAMARAPEDRFPSAAALADALVDWLDGMSRRERAIAVLCAANAIQPEMESLESRERALRTDAARLLGSVPPHAGAEAKAPAWDLLDEADRTARQRRLTEARWLTALHGALAVDASLAAAHEALATHYRGAVIAAEAEGRLDDAVQFESLLRVHDRGAHAAFLSGKGALTLITDPPDATAALHRYELIRRRLVPRKVRDLGRAPLVEVPLDRGSHLVVLEAPGRRPVLYPVSVGRGEHWDGRPPGSESPLPIRLPREDELDADEVLVPAGWTWIGGDREAPDSLPAQRVWVDAFVIDRHPVTEEAYLAFLNDLVVSGREREALIACPRSRLGAGLPTADRLAFERGADGLFMRATDDPVLQGDPLCPAALMSFHGARIYACWRARKTGRPYRLPHEIEREKAARGVDGRMLPWGDASDPSWACMLESHAGEPRRAPVTSFPDDESPYGARGMAGNTRDFCGNVWRREGPALVAGRLAALEEDPGGEEHVSVRGGAWSSVANHCRPAARFGMRPDQHRSSTGIRLVRSLPG